LLEDPISHVSGLKMDQARAESWDSFETMRKRMMRN